MAAIEIGSVIYSAVKPIFKIYLIMASGFLLAKLNVLSVEVTRALSDMIVMLIMPCLAFNKIVTSISISDLKAIGVICLSAAILYSLGAVCSLITITLTPVPKKWRGGCLAGGIFPNISDLPIAYIQTLDTGLVFNETEGNKGVAYVCIFLMTFLFCQFNCGGFRLIEYDFHDHTKPDVEKQRGDHVNRQRPSFANSDKGNSKPDVNDQEHAEKLSSNEESSSNGAAQTQGPAEGNQSGAKNAIINDVNGDNYNPEAGVNGQNTDNADDPESPISAVTSLSSSVADSLEMNNPGTKRYVKDNGMKPASILSSRKRRESNTSSLHRNSYLAPVSSALTQLSTNGSYNNHSLTNAVSRNLELRSMPSQTARNVITEYSHTNNLPALNRLDPITKIATTELGATSRHDIDQAGANIPFVQKYHLNWLVFVMQNFLRPVSVSLLLSILVSLVPWLKALFVHTSLVPDMKDAPDKLPPLSFLIDYTSYIGQASVPLGLLLLGTTMSRLSVNNVDKKFLLSSLTLVVLRLCVMPIVGVGWSSKLRDLNWVDNNMIFFVICIMYALPSATTQFYFTASYTDPEVEDTTQMDCLSIYLLMEYLLLCVSLPFLVTYVVMKQLNF